MKGIKKIFLLLTLVTMVTLQPFTVMADSNSAIDVTREYLDDGSYFEIVHTATFCGQQGRISRTVRAILNGQPGLSAGQRVLRPTDQY